MPFINKNLFVSERCIMYRNCCFDSGLITHNLKEIFINHFHDSYTKIQFDEFKELFTNVEQLYRRIIFLRFGVPEDPK